MLSTATGSLMKPHRQQGETIDMPGAAYKPSESAGIMRKLK